MAATTEPLPEVLTDQLGVDVNGASGAVGDVTDQLGVDVPDVPDVPNVDDVLGGN